MFGPEAEEPVNASASARIRHRRSLVNCLARRRLAAATTASNGRDSNSMPESPTDGSTATASWAAGPGPLVEATK
jgi:hypothetical protein